MSDESQNVDERSRLLPAIPHRNYVYADELVLKQIQTNKQRNDELIEEIVFCFQSPILEPAMSNYVVSEGQATKKWPQYVAALAATGGALAAGESTSTCENKSSIVLICGFLGTALGWTSPANPKLINANETQYDFVLDEEEASWVGSSLNLGAAAMCIPIGILLNIIGRKWSLLGMVIPFTIGWALMLWAQSLAMLIIGRVFTGIASGAFCVAAPLYIGETAQKEIRGTLGSYFQLMVTIGILFTYAVGAGATVFVLTLICGIIPLIFAAVFFFMPGEIINEFHFPDSIYMIFSISESPMYLVIREKNQQASAAIKWLRGSKYDPAEDIAELQNENEELKSRNLSVKEALSKKASIRALIISLGLMFFQQVSGINAVIFYTNDIFIAAGSDIKPSIAAIIVGVMQVVATFIASLVVDRLGRRLLLLASDAIMALCTILLGIFFFMKQNDESSVDSIGWLPVVSLCIFIVAFSIGFGPVPWLMMGELFAPDVKTIAAPLAGTFNWLLGKSLNLFSIT